MNNRAFLILSGLLTVLSTASAQSRNEPPPRRGGGGPVGPLEVYEPPTEAGIAWFGTWDGALAEAERTNRPILIMSAAPQCRNVPGVW